MAENEAPRPRQEPSETQVQPDAPRAPWHAPTVTRIELKRTLLKAQVLTQKEASRYSDLFSVSEDRFVYIPWPLHDGGRPARCVSDELSSAVDAQLRQLGKGAAVDQRADRRLHGGNGPARGRRLSAQRQRSTRTCSAATRPRTGAALG